MRFDFAKALRSNPAVLIAAAVAVAVDIRAFILLLRRKEGALLPHPLLRVGVCYFALWTFLVNIAMLAGFDLLGDLARYWHLPVWRFWLFVPLAFLLTTFAALAICDFPALARFRTAIGAAVLFVLPPFAAVLWGKWYLLLFLIPVLAGMILWTNLQKKRRAKEKTP